MSALEEEVARIAIREIEPIVQRAVEPLRVAIVKVQQDVATLKGDVATLKDDVATLKSDVATLKSDVAEIKRLLRERPGAPAG